jgi:phosphoribosylglycinamide formyltransferase 1
MTDRRVGLFSTLNGPGSLALVTRVAAACRDGTVPGMAVAGLLVNRAPGESAATDAAVATIAATFDFPIVRTSAYRCRKEERQAARAAAEAGDPEPLWAWRDAWYATFRDQLPPTDMDLLLGDMWVWGRRQCAERRGVNLHPALPSGPLGKIWYDVVWDLIASQAEASGVMLHLVTPEVDMGPLVSWCAYSLRGPALAPLWDELPRCLEERVALIASQRLLQRAATHPLFKAVRAHGVAREVPLMLATLAALAAGRLVLTAAGATDGSGHPLPGGLDLTDDVEALVARQAPAGVTG